jgi:hypothetical protein
LLSGFGKLPVSFHDLSEQLPLAVTTGRRDELFPDSFAKRVFHVAPTTILKDGARVQAVGRIYRYEGEVMSDKDFLAVVDLSLGWETVYLVPEKEFDQLTTKDEQARVRTETRKQLGLS